MWARLQSVQNIRCKLRSSLTRISAADWFHCPPFVHVVAAPSIAGLDCLHCAHLVEPAGCPDGVSRCRLAVGGRSTASRRRCRRRRHRHRHLPVLRPGGVARKIHCLETPSPGCYDYACVASTSEVGCRELKRLEEHQTQDDRRTLM